MSTTTKFVANINKVIEALGTDDASTILDIIDVSLSEAVADVEVTVKWQCEVEKVWWTITAKLMNLTDCYAVRWTHADEVGVDDAEIVERVDDEADAVALKKWVRGIASEAGSSNGKVRDA